MNGLRHKKPYAKALRMGLFTALSAILLLAFSACGRQQAAPDQTPTPASAGANQAGQNVGMGTLNDNLHSVQGQDNNVDGVSPQRDAADTPAEQKIEVSQNIADAVAELDEVKTANVLVTDDSAYVAVVLEQGAGQPLGASPSPSPDQSPEAAEGTDFTPAAQGENGDAADAGVSDELKNRIAQKAQTVNTNIKRVYVSASPDFVQRMNTFRQDIQNGRPVAGFIKEFYTVVERLFPTRAGQNNPVVAP